MENPSSLDEQPCVDLYRVQGDKQFPEHLMVLVTINGIPIRMEVDTSAKASLIGRNIYLEYFSDIPLQPTATLVWGTPLDMLGEFKATVWYKDQEAQLTIAVVNREFPALFGLPWLQYIHLDWVNLVPPVLSICSEVETS